MHNILTY